GADFAAAVTRVAHAASLVNKTAAEDDRVTQFEALTAAAYHELARRGVEVAVIEAGLGGRYDATNVIPSKVQVLTSVGLEHTRWLGPTITDRARGGQGLPRLAVGRRRGRGGRRGARARTARARVVRWPARVPRRRPQPGRRGGAGAGVARGDRRTAPRRRDRRARRQGRGGDA